jgi:phage terminase small subunit
MTRNRLQRNGFRSQPKRIAITEIDFKPPRPLSIAARQMWDRHASRIHAEGRWQQIDHDMLCTYCETTELYLRFKKDIDDHGTLVQGRLKHEMVRNPSLMGLSQARADLIRLAKAVPLVHPRPDMDGVEVDAFLEEIK